MTINDIPKVLDKRYQLVPGTTIFDSDKSAQGYALNQMCMSFMNAANRERYLKDEKAYLDAWPGLTEPQKQALLDRNLNAAMAEGGNIYFLSKWGAMLGLSFQQMAGSMTGMSEQEYAQMMLDGGRTPVGNRLDHAIMDAAYADVTPPTVHATITGSIYTSHIPVIGHIVDSDRTQEPYWKPVFDGYEFVKQYERDNLPDVIFLVYNDHATSFDLSRIPTFALGTAPYFETADEGYGPRPIPGIENDPEFAAHIAHSLIRDDFDLTLINEMEVDHGLTVPMSLIFGKPENWPGGVWPCKIIPFHVNVVQYPVPSGKRCFELGQALRKAIESYDKPLKVQVWSTGGMSHQLQGPRAGLINEPWDNAFLDKLIADPAGLAEVPHLEYVNEAGSEGIELVMWLIARGAMADINGSGTIEVEHRFYHVPASNTAVGHLVISNHPASED
jgi:gallate dioxygenase